MTRVRLHESSPEFSRVAFGTWRLSQDPATATPEGVLALLRACLDAGVTTIDTAEIYGIYKIEELLGEALKLDGGVKRRLEIVTKAGIYVPCEFHPDRRVAHYNATSERLVKSARKSLRLLGVETLDLFLVHRPDWLTGVDETAAGLTELLRSGLIRAAGVSNYTASQFAALQSRLDFPLVTNQVEFSPLRMEPVYDGVFDQAQERRFRPMAWSPLAGGRLFSETDDAAVRLREALREMAPRYENAAPDQLALAWVLAHPSGPLPVLGTSKVERIRAAARADEITLSREDWYGIWQAARGRRVP